MNIMHYTHGGDIDGLGCEVLAYFAFGYHNTFLVANCKDLENILMKAYKKGELYNYSRIYITDLSIPKSIAEMISKDKKLRNKIFIFDHHASALDIEEYDFVTIKLKKDNGEKECATSIFYDYLLDCGLIEERTPSMDTFVEYTRLEDTWEWVNKGRKGAKAHQLATLLNSFGEEPGIGSIPYIGIVMESLLYGPEKFEIPKDDRKRITNTEKKYKKELKEIWNKALILTDEFGNTFGITSAPYIYRNELALYVEKHNKKLKYIMIYAKEEGKYGQISYRSIEKNFDVLSLAEKRGGGGHRTAAGVLLTKEDSEKIANLSKEDALKYLGTNISNN